MGGQTDALDQQTLGQDSALSAFLDWTLSHGTESAYEPADFPGKTPPPQRYSPRDTSTVFLTHCLYPIDTGRGGRATIALAVSATDFLGGGIECSVLAGV